MNSLLERLKRLRFNSIALPLKRIVLNIFFFVLKRALKIRLNLLQLLKLRIRQAVPSARLEGDDKIFDEILHIASLKLLHPDIFTPEGPDSLRDDYTEELKDIHNKLRADYEINREKVNGLIKDIGEKKDTLNVQKKYWLVCQYTESLQKKQELAAYYMEKVKSLDPEAVSLTSKSLKEIRKTTKKELRQVRSVISDRSAIKISLSSPSIVAILSLISTLFLITGYLYNRFLLSAFDIEVSNFFSLGDYISASIEGLRYSVVGAVVAIISFFIGIHHASRKSAAQIDFESSQKDYFPHFIIFLSVTTFVFGYVNNLPTMYDGIQLGILFTGLYASVHVANKYFKEPMVAVFIIVFAVSFGAHLFASISKEIHRIEYGGVSKLKKYKFVFSNDIDYPEEKLILIASSGEFFIFRNLDEKTSVVIPRNRVLSVTSIRNQETKPTR